MALRYFDAWLRGTGAVALDGLMEDAAAAEISRAQIWQWLRHRAVDRDAVLGLHAVAHLPAGADERHIVTAGRERFVGLYGISACRASHATGPAQLFLDFGDVGERAIAEGIATIGPLTGRS
ncbi:hypothetical protein SL103_17670 [Streptomyces lydicus]|uniref:Malate synthase C-terminal domain-containing protein n=1 Tax=Streptomyces lydicus TaxID=47763 RepID=A0A1D7VM80_9ACTN|nr:hypothetical protein SL103_17670 [Streptomyces lydicus]